MTKYTYIILLFMSLFSFSQQEKVKDSTLHNDLKYREDQFYLALTYNFLANKPTGMTQQGLSGGIHLGFIRDMPINKKRNIAIGVGLGYSNNSYNHNLLIQENNNQINYSLLNTNLNQYSKNKFNTHEIAIPIQFRWRTSTPESHKFWRIYTGIKLNYIFYSVLKHKGDAGNFKLKNPEGIERFQPAIDIGFGWNTWNFYASYGINKLVKNSANLNGEPLGFRSIKFGLIFYIF